jgi:hypothetical protein
MEVPMPEKVTVHDPRGFPPKVTAQPLAPRVEGLDGRSVFLVDCLFDNSAVFMAQLKSWFSEHMPKVDTHIIRPKESWKDDPEMCARIIREGDAAILGVGL